MQEGKVNILKDIIARNRERVFVTSSVSGKGLTYGGLNDYSNALASKFKEMGVGKGDRVAVLLPNSLEFAVTLFANMRLGAVSVPINPIFHTRDIRYILEATGVRLLVTNKDLKKEASSALEGYKGKIYLACELLKKGPPLKRKGAGFPCVREDDLIAISYTSGTTQNPKGVMVSYGAVISNAGRFIERLELDSEMVFYCPLSLAYMAGWYNLLLLPFLCEARTVIDETFNAASIFTFWDRVMRYRINVLWMVPTIMAILLTHKNEKARDYCRKNIKRALVGTAPLPLPLKKTFEDEFQVTLYENYGLSELLFVTTNSPALPRKEGFVGKPLEGCKIYIADEKGRRVKAGCEGEVVVKSDYIMKGYYGIPGKGKMHRGKAFHTGDVGKMDRDGYLLITGRKKDLIIKGGINISPRSIEEVLYTFKPVEDAAVIGMPSEIYGEDVIAVIKMKDDHKKHCNEKDLAGFCSKNLSKFEQPRRFIIIDEMPKSSSGKIQKEKLKVLLRNVGF